MKFADKTAIRSKIMISPLGIESQTFPLWLFLYWPITLVMASQERRRFWMARSSAWMSAGILDSMDCTLVTKSGTDSCAASDIPITVDISNVKYHCRARGSDWLCLSPAVLLQGKIASWVPSRGMTHHSFPQKQPAHILAAGRSIISGMVKPFIQPVRRRRGNPNWGRPLPPAPTVATEFETQVRHLGLTKQTCTGSVALRNWCERNKNRCYIPEWLLEVGNRCGTLRQWRSVTDTANLFRAGIRVSWRVLMSKARLPTAPGTASILMLILPNSVKSAPHLVEYLLGSPNAPARCGIAFCVVILLRGH